MVVFLIILKRILSAEYLEMITDENLDDNKKEMTVDHIIWS